MGVVYRGVSAAGEPVAVKQIRGISLTDQDKARFRSEIEALKIVYGARVVPFIAGDSDPDDGAPWLAVKYIPGLTLLEHVKTQGPLEPVLAAILGAALAEGLQSIHKASLLHRDLKPQNIICGHDGPFIIDFGLALLAEAKVRKAEDPARLTMPGDTVGTLVCMPPEQVRGEALDEAADVYALGATLLYSATGHYPYSATNQFALSVQINSPSVMPDLAGLPVALVSPIGAMLAMEATQRPTLDEVAATFVQVVKTAGFDAVRARELLRRTTAPSTAREAEPRTPDIEVREREGRTNIRSPRSRQIDEGSSPQGALLAARYLRTSYARSSTM